MENYDDFKKYFGTSKSGKFWKTITHDSLIPLIDVPTKETLLSEIYKEISTSIYRPGKPRGYILINKGESIARLIPVFTPKDICVYYYCTKKLESDIAVNRTPNTYGGWNLGGKLRKEEEAELKYLSSNMRKYEMPDGTIIGLDESVEYSMEASFNPKAWKRNWVDFTGSIYTHSRVDIYTHAAELDIANFYDNININVLKEKLKRVSKDTASISLLLNFLKKWDSSVNFANNIYRGIPQDEMADCSRLIANFYLQDFDNEMYSLCNEYGAKYFRFADDQVILATSEKDLNEIIARASVMILKHGLCFNHRKAKIMMKNKFEEYFAFDWFISRNDLSILDPKTVKKDLKFYTSSRDKLRNSGISVFIRILALTPNKVDKPTLQIIRNVIMDKDFLTSPKLDAWHLAKLHGFMDQKGKTNLINELKQIALQTLHNRYHFVLLKFFKSIREDTEEIQSQIEELNRTFNLN